MRRIHPTSVAVTSKISSKKNTIPMTQNVVTCLKSSVQNALDTPGDSSNDNTFLFDYTTTPLYKCLKPLMISLRLQGLHHVYFTSYTNEKKKKFCNLTPGLIYCWLVLIFLFLYFLAELIFMRQIQLTGQDEINYVSGLIYTFQNVLTSICLLRASHTSKALRKFFLTFKNLDHFGGAFSNLTRVRNILNIALACLLTYYVLYSIVYFYMVFELKFYTLINPNIALNNSDNVTGTRRDNDEGLSYVGYNILYCFYSLFGQALWLQINVLELCFSLLIYNEFLLHSKHFKAKLQIESDLTSFFEFERHRYLHMLRLVQAADNTLMLHHAASFCCDVGLLCLLTYGILYFPLLSLSNSLLSIAYLLWITFAIIDLSIICFCGSLVCIGVSRTIN